MVARRLEALDHATRDIPPDRMRLHLCWGNYEGPHQGDVPLADIIDLVLAARPAAVSFEAANPRHEHEWAVFEDVRLPEGKVVIPGVLDSTTNYIEHPELVAQRLVRYAGRGGPAERDRRQRLRLRHLRRTSCPSTRRSPGPSSPPWPKGPGWPARNCGRRVPRSCYLAA